MIAEDYSQLMTEFIHSGEKETPGVPCLRVIVKPMSITGAMIAAVNPIFHNIQPHDPMYTECNEMQLLFLPDSVGFYESADLDEKAISDQVRAEKTAEQAAKQNAKKKQEEKQIKQTELLDLCKEKGYNISQSELSRILSNKISLSLYSALALCDALDLDLNLLFHSGKIRNNGFHLSKEVFITDPEQSEIKNYLGVYHTLFHGTDSREEKLLRGRLELTSKKEGEYLQCIATFTLDTKDKDMLGKQILKKYQGQFFVS